MPTETEVLEVLAYLEAAYPMYSAGEHTPAVYIRELGDLPVEQLWLAARTHISLSAFFPSVHELRRAALKALPDRRAARSGREVWETVLQAIQRVGYAGTPEWSDPLVAEVIRRMGWRRLCLSDNVPAERKHFCDLYDQLLREATDLALLPADVRQTLTALTATPVVPLIAEGRHGDPL